MQASQRRTKIVATIGPASSSPAVLRKLLEAGMDVARLNFSHGSCEDHKRNISSLRTTAAELNTPITILQDLQGPKVRVGQLPAGEIRLEPEQTVALLPESQFTNQENCIPIDYPHVASEARPG